MSRLRDEAIKAAEDKKEEEKKREEEEREKKPGKDGIRVRLKICFCFYLYLILKLLQAADAAEPADRAEDERLCEAADVRERSRVGDVEEEEALPNFCIRFVFILSLFSFLGPRGPLVEPSISPVPSRPVRANFSSVHR